MQQIDVITQRFIEPLNDSTKKLFRPINFMQNDRLHIELDDEKKRFIFNFFAIFSDGTKTSPSWCVRKFMERIPERKRLWDNISEQWKVAGTDFTVLLVNGLWEAEKLTFTKEAKDLYDYLLLRFLKQIFNSQI